jgi:hypothetical protein
MMIYLMMAEDEELKEKNFGALEAILLPEFRIMNKKKEILVGLNYL